jgi:hypothetical protein
LLAILGAAQKTGRRGAVLREIVDCALHLGAYRGSVEELQPLRGDIKSALLLAAAGVATTVNPGVWSYFAGGAVAQYALSPAG